MATRVTELMLINTKKFVDAYHPGKWDEVLEGMDEKTRRCYAGRLVPARWVQFDVIRDLLRSVSAVLADRDSEVMHRLGRHNAEENLKFTQRMLMKILTVKLVLKIAGFLWTGRVKDGGTMVVISTGRSAAKCRIESPPDVSEHWWRYLAGWFQRTIELAGGKDVDSRWTGGGAAAGETAQFEVSWK